MARFIVRRVIAMVAVLFAISVITFMIFNVIPNGDPAVRLAGKSPTPMTIAVVLGLFTAVKAGRFADRALTVLALTGISMPVFLVGALMSYYLGFKWGIFPNGGYVKFTESPIQWAYHLILPWTALSLLF